MSDGQGCFENGSITVPPGDSVLVSIVESDISCNGANDGQAVATIVGTSPYQYQWSNGADSSVATELGPGTISLLVTDALAVKAMPSFP